MFHGDALLAESETAPRSAERTGTGRVAHRNDGGPGRAKDTESFGATFEWRCQCLGDGGGFGFRVPHRNYMAIRVLLTGAMSTYDSWFGRGKRDRYPWIRETGVGCGVGVGRCESIGAA